MNYVLCVVFVSVCLCLLIHHWIFVPSLMVCTYLMSVILIVLSWFKEFQFFSKWACVKVTRVVFHMAHGAVVCVHKYVGVICNLWYLFSVLITHDGDNCCPGPKVYAVCLRIMISWWFFCMFDDVVSSVYHNYVEVIYPVVIYNHWCMFSVLVTHCGDHDLRG